MSCSCKFYTLVTHQMKSHIDETLYTRSLALKGRQKSEVSYFSTACVTERAQDGQIGTI